MDTIKISTTFSACVSHFLLSIILVNRREKCCLRLKSNRKCICYFAIIPLVVAVLTIAIFLPVSIVTSSTILKRDRSIVFIQELSSRGIDDPYGVLWQGGTISSLDHESLRFSTECDLKYNAAVVLIRDDERIETLSIQENNQHILVPGDAFSEVYAIGNFTFNSTITGQPESKLNYTVIRAPTTGELTENSCNGTVDIKNQSSAFITCSSNKTGYYKVLYYFPDNVTGTMITNVTYDVINATYYSESRMSCTINNNEKRCDIPLTFEKGVYKAIIILKSGERCEEFTIESSSGYTNPNLIIFLPVGVLLFVLLIICPIVGYCRRKKMEQLGMQNPITASNIPGRRTSTTSHSTPPYDTIPEIETDNGN